MNGVVTNYTGLYKGRGEPDPELPTISLKELFTEPTKRIW